MAPPPPPKKPGKPGVPVRPGAARPGAKPAAGAKPKPKVPQRLPEGLEGEGGAKPPPKRAYIEMNRSSWIMAGISLVISIVGVILLVLSLYRFMSKMGFESGMNLYASNRLESAGDPLLSALGWDGENADIREMLAKVNVETENFPAAQTEYDALEPKNRAATFVGRGVCFLREADKSKEPARVRELAGKADAAFQKALAADSQCLEGRIGRASAKLMFARGMGLANNPAEQQKLIASAATDFNALLTEIEGSADKRALLTREGYIDLYAGFGKANFRPGRYDPRVHDAFKKAYQMRPIGSLMLYNMIVAEAQKFFHPDLCPAAKAQEIITSMIQQKWTVYFNQSLEPHDSKLKAAKIAYYMTFCYWLVETVRNPQHWLMNGPNLMNDRRFEANLGALALGCWGFTTFVLRDLESDICLGNSNLIYDKFLKHPNLSGELKDEKLKQLRAFGLNNAALSHWVATMQAFKRDLPNKKAAFDPVRAALGEALKMYPEEYIYNRNLAVGLGFMSCSPDATPESKEEAYKVFQKAESLGKGHPERESDLKTIKAKYFPER